MFHDVRYLVMFDITTLYWSNIIHQTNTLRHIMIHLFYFGVVQNVRMRVAPREDPAQTDLVCISKIGAQNSVINKYSATAYSNFFHISQVSAAH